MTPDEFQELLQRSLSGELSEEEALRLYREILGSPAALEEFLAARGMDHDLKRLLAPGAHEDAFLRGLLNVRSTERQDPEAFVRSVTRAHSRSGRRITTRRAALQQRRSFGVPAFVLLAAGLLVGAFAMWFLLSPRSPSSGTPERQGATGPNTPAEHDKVGEPAREALKPWDPLREQQGPAELVRPPEKRVDPLPPPPEPKPATEEGGVPRKEGEKEKSVPESPAPKPAPRPTLTAFATIQKAKGDVYVFTESPARKSPATEGQVLTPGQGVLTEGSQSMALLARHDATRLTLNADTQIRFAEARSEIALFQGRIEVEADTREAGQEVLLTTAHAEVRVQACRLALTSGPLSTTLELRQGAALFTNVLDGKAMEVKPGQRVFAQELPGIDRNRIDEAIRKGIAYLKTAPSQGIDAFSIPNCDELVLLALLSAGIGESDPDFQKYLKNSLSAALGRTYIVSLKAMVLEELDRVKYQDKIAECAQFLVDNQCVNGQWTYGGEPSKATFVTEIPSGTATPGAPRKEAGADLFGRRAKPTVVRRLQLKKTRSGAAQGDNSNAQYAALGLRACSEAGIAIPAETLQLAAGWWRKSQYAEDAARGVASGEGGTARGWCYSDGKNPVNGFPCCSGAYSSMTAGAVSSLLIYDHLLGADWKKDVTVRLGLNWMSNYFTVARNLGIEQAFKMIPGATTSPVAYHYYGLYALERVGILSGQEKLGRHAWYAEGAKVLLGKQKADGSWDEASQSSHSTWDTCFAILFLRRATRPLADVASEDRFVPKTPRDK